MQSTYNNVAAVHVVLQCAGSFLAFSEYLRMGYTRVNKYKKGTNICHFCRTLLLGCVTLAVTIATYLYTCFCILILPFLLFPGTRIALNIFIVVAIVTTSTVIVGGFVYTCAKIIQFL